MVNVEFDDAEICAWFRVYVLEKHEDPHSEFSRMLCISRQEAKRLANEINYRVVKSKVVEHYYD